MLEPRAHNSISRWCDLHIFDVYLKEIFVSSNEWLFREINEAEKVSQTIAKRLP